MPEKPKLLIVDWKDASYGTGTSSWTRAQMEDYTIESMRTVGFLFKEREDCLVMYAEKDVGEDTFRHTYTIPLNCIVKVTEVAYDVQGQS